MRRLGALAIAALVAACQFPVSSAKGPGPGLTLNFVISGAGSSTTQKASARLLLPTVSTLTVTLTPQNSSLKTLTATASIASGASVVPVTFGQVATGTYTVAAQAFDASGTLQFQQTAPLTLGAAQTSTTLNLVPVFTSTTNQLAYGQSVSGTVLAGTAQSWAVPSSSLVSGGWGLTLTASTSLLLFAQDSDGAAFPAGDTIGTVTTVQVTNGGTSFITLYNPTGTDQAFQFVLSAPTIPVPQYKVTSWVPYFSASFAPSSTTVVYVDLTDSLSVSFQLPASGSGLTFSYLDQNGLPLTGIATANSVSVAKSQVGGTTGFFITIVNTTAAAVTAPGGREAMTFALDPTQVTSYAVALDNGTSPGRIDVFSLNETTGAVALLSQVPLSAGFIASRIIPDPGTRRFYVTGNSGSYALDGYTLSATGALTEISGFPQAGLTNLTIAPVITPDQNLYWTDAANALNWVPIAADGTLTAGAPNSWGSSANPVISLAYSAGNNLLVVGSMAGTLSAYQPIAAGGATALTTSLSGSAPNAHSPTSYVDQPLGTLFQLFNNAFYTFTLNNGGSPVQITQIVQSVTQANVGPAFNPSGLAAYFSPYALAPPYTVAGYSVSSSTASITATGASWTVPSGNPVKVIATDPAGACVLVADSAGNQYSLAGGSLTQIGATVSVPSAVFADLAVVRVQ